MNAFDILKERGVTLMITVDTGITAAEEVAYARTLGIDTVVTDHHECRTALPAAVAVVNPHRPDCPYPFKELAGVGVVFKLICAYEEKVEGLSKMEACFRIFSEYADLVAIGTIDDTGGKSALPVTPLCKSAVIFISFITFKRLLDAAPSVPKTTFTPFQLKPCLPISVFLFPPTDKSAS